MITMIDLIKDSKELGLKDWAEESQDQLVGVDSLTVLKLKYQWDHDNNYPAFHLNIDLFFLSSQKLFVWGYFYVVFFRIHKANFRSVCGGWVVAETAITPWWTLLFICNSWRKSFSISQEQKSSSFQWEKPRCKVESWKSPWRWHLCAA